MPSRLLVALRTWIPLAIAVTGVCGLVYLAVQQDFRMSLNDPQVQLAEDASVRLSEGAKPSAVTASGTVEVGASLGAFVNVYDDSGKPLLAAGTLDGTAAVPPPGVFQYTLRTGEDRVTWQPRPGVRIAAVVERYQGKTGSGFVVAGRNMREVESRITQLSAQVAAAWLVTMLATLAAVLMLTPAAPKPPRPAEE